MTQNRGRSLTYAAIAQLVERLICNQQVGSSTLSGGLGFDRAYGRNPRVEFARGAGPGPTQSVAGGLGRN